MVSPCVEHETFLLAQPNYFQFGKMNKDTMIMKGDSHLELLLQEAKLSVDCKNHMRNILTGGELRNDIKPAELTLTPSTNSLPT